MTDRPIIFSAPMVRALLAGRKTQTRQRALLGICMKILQKLSHRAGVEGALNIVRRHRPVQVASIGEQLTVAADCGSASPFHDQLVVTVEAFIKRSDPRSFASNSQRRRHRENNHIAAPFVFSAPPIVRSLTSRRNLILCKGKYLVGAVLIALVRAAFDEPIDAQVAA